MRTKIGDLVFDAVLKVDHTSSLTITDHPVENGPDITDHSQLQPQELTIEVGMTDTGMLYGGSGGGRSVSAFQQLKALQASRQPFSVTTRLGSYKNMLIRTITAPDDYTTMHALRATVDLREIILVDTATVGVSGRSSDAQTTGSTNAGTQQSTAVSSTDDGTSKSALKSLIGMIGGVS